MSRKMIQSLGPLLAGAAAICLLSSTGRAVSGPAGEWTISGPFGGTARSIALDPEKPEVVLAGGMNSLLFRSEDAGQHWHLLNFPKRNLSEVTSILIDPKDSNHYLVGIISAEDGGLFESKDAGQTWDSVKAISRFGVRALTASVSEPSKFVAGTLHGVWISQNAGQDWKRASDADNLEMQGITVVAIDSKDSNTIYAGTSHLPWKSSDGGKTWQSIHEGMIDDSDVFSIFVDPANPMSILASACSGIYASGNRGDQWRKLMGIPNTSRRTHVIREDPSNPDTIYAGTTTGLYKSLNRGGTWKTLSNTQANSMVFDPAHAGSMYLALEYDGIGKSDNGGDTIRLTNEGFVDRSIASVTRSNDKLYAIETQDGETTGIFSSADKGATWNQMSGIRGLAGVHLKAISGLPDQSNVLLAASPHQMYKSVDGGSVWKAIPIKVIQPPPPPVAEKPATTPSHAVQHRSTAHTTVRSRVKRPVKPVVKIREMNPSEISALYGIKSGGQDLMFAATDLGLLKSTDGGERWTLAVIGGSPAVTALYFAPDFSGDLIARAADGLFVSKDCGDHWESLPFPLRISDLKQIALPGGPSQMLLAATRLGLYSSADKGATWTHDSSGMPASTVSSVLFAGAEGNAFAVEYGRLFQSADAGKSWKEVPSMLPSQSIRQLWLPDPSSSRLYGITGDVGILFRDDAIIR